MNLWLLLHLLMAEAHCKQREGDDVRKLYVPGGEGIESLLSSLIIKGKDMAKYAGLHFSQLQLVAWFGGERRSSLGVRMAKCQEMRASHVIFMAWR